MNVLLLVICILSCIAGYADGTQDSIAWHNTYKHRGDFWDINSWKLYYLKPKAAHPWYQRLMGAQLNAWHVMKWIKMACLFTSIVLAHFCPEHLWYEWLAFVAFQVFFYLIFFKIFFI